MPSNNYHFITVWRVKATIEEVSDILADAEALVRWWPSVYLDVKTLQQGDAKDIGKVVSLYTKGWLPYTLRWQFEVTENIRPHGFTLIAKGDFEGRGIWRMEQQGDEAVVTYDWKINAEKPLLRYLSFVMKPLFSANHQWAMRKGEESLKLELLRRHAANPKQLSAIPSPPPPTFKWMMGKKMR